MAWFKVDDKLHSAPKLMSIPRKYRLAALGLWTLAGSWSADQLTDGVIPDYMVEEWGGTKTLVDWLVKADLWRKVEDGTEFKNWDEYQPTKADVESDREKNREKLRKWRERNKGTDEGVTGLQEGPKRVSNPAPDPTRPDPTYKEEAKASSSPAKRGTRIPADFAVAPAMVAWSRANCPSVDGQRETLKFINYWQAKAGRDGVKLDWPATWRNWMLNAAERAPQGKPTVGDKMRDTIQRAQALQERLDQQAPTQLQIGA